MKQGTKYFLKNGVATLGSGLGVYITLNTAEYLFNKSSYNQNEINSKYDLCKEINQKAYSVSSLTKEDVSKIQSQISKLTPLRSSDFSNLENISINWKKIADLYDPKDIQHKKSMQNILLSTRGRLSEICYSETSLNNSLSCFGTVSSLSSLVLTGFALRGLYCLIFYKKFRKESV